MDELYSLLKNHEDYSSDVLAEPTIDQQYTDFLRGLTSLNNTNVFNNDLLNDLQEIPDFSKLDITSKQNSNTILKIPDFQEKTHLRYSRKGLSGEIVGFEENIKYDELLLSENDKVFSLNRKIDYTTNKITGSSNNQPFLPGLNDLTRYDKAETFTFEKNELGLYETVPFMKRGIMPLFDSIDQSSEEKTNEVLKNILNLEELSENNDDINDIRKEILKKIEANEDKEVSDSLLKLKNLLLTDSDNVKKSIDDLLPETLTFGRVKKQSLKKNDVQIYWAHEVDINHQIPNFNELVPNPARTWPFELDTFQKEAILHMEQGDSVFVAAHTSAGKTVVAEYAIAMSKRNMTKTIYTSPIKALSNQKFRDFKETFDDVEVGLITGDVQINKDADVLIMTTEILRSMLYKGADLLKDVEFVIFDEVHYINDQERGVVWEEVIIMLPPYVKFVLLSATVPNTFEFANWIGRTKEKNIYVISTSKRPTPLEINIWAKDHIIPVIDENRKFLENNFKKHVNILTPKQEKKDNKGNKTVVMRGGDGPNKNTWPSLFGDLKRQNLLPAVIFVFSQKKCSEYADSLSNSNFITAKESSHVRMIIDRSISRLKKEDRELPQILAITSLLQKGIAVHHGGLLPIIKELVEILFAEGYIKILFATETFAMGLNLPTKTVVFSSIKKHDGTQMRYLTPGEFTQMAGRAGRRGLDDHGTVIVMTYKTPLESLVFKETTLGKPTKLESQFRLTYNSIVSLLRIESVKMEDMIQSSFGEDKGQQYKLETKAKEIGYEGLLNSELINELKIDCDACQDDNLKQLLSKIDELVLLKEDILKISMNTKAVAVKIKTGRVLIYKSVVDQKICFNVGIVFKNNSKKGSLCVLKITEDFHIDFNINANQSKFYIPYMSKMSLFHGGFQITDNFHLVDILINDLEYLVDLENRKLLFMVLANDLSNEKKIPKMVASVIKSLQPFELKGMLDFDLVKKLERQKTLQNDILSLDKDLKKCQNFPLHLFEKWQIEEVLKEARSNVNNELKLLPDYENRLNVLKSMGFVDDTETVQLKGRVVAEITIGYELVITEIMFDNFMSDLSPEEIVALLSCFVYNGTDTVDSEAVLLTNKLIMGKKKIEEKYNEFLSYSSIHQIPLVNEEAQFLERNRFQLVNVVYQWASGVSFAEIMKVSPQSEGTIVRIINRLNELCKQLKNASIIVGNSDMHLKFSTAQDLINRDIVFAASLYL